MRKPQFIVKELFLDESQDLDWSALGERGPCQPRVCGRPDGSPARPELRELRQLRHLCRAGLLPGEGLCARSGVLRKTGMLRKGLCARLLREAGVLREGLRRMRQVQSLLPS
jgi:hypothetical protein